MTVKVYAREAREMMKRKCCTRLGEGPSMREKQGWHTIDTSDFRWHTQLYFKVRWRRQGETQHVQTVQVENWKFAAELNKL